MHVVWPFLIYYANTKVSLLGLWRFCICNCLLILYNLINNVFQSRCVLWVVTPITYAITDRYSAVWWWDALVLWHTVRRLLPSEKRWYVFQRMFLRWALCVQVILVYGIWAERRTYATNIKNIVESMTSKISRAYFRIELSEKVTCQDILKQYRLKGCVLANQLLWRIVFWFSFKIRSPTSS